MYFFISFVILPDFLSDGMDLDVNSLVQNGFSVDDGELREYTSPESREFLQAVMRGSPLD